MNNYKDISEFFEQKGPEDIERFVDKNLDISQTVYKILKEKNITVLEFAELLGKDIETVSNWLCGTHNLTLRQITKMEAILHTDIIISKHI